MKSRDIEKLNNYFKSKKGWEASLANCFEEHDCLVIGLYGFNQEAIGVSFFNTSYISGAFRLNDVSFECSLCELEEGIMGVQLADRTSGFVLRSYGPVKLGDTGEVMPYQ